MTKSGECRVCGNAENNRVHTAREMMLGKRDRFDYVECVDCGAIQIATVPDLASYYPKDYYSFAESPEPELTKRFSTRVAARLAGRYLVNRRDPIGAAIIRYRPWTLETVPPSLLDSIVSLRFDSRILDVGCGSGWLLNLLRAYGFRNVQGVDAFIEHDLTYSNGVTVFKRDISAVTAGFDLVMMHHAFEHVPDPLGTLEHVRRLLADDRAVCLIRIPIGAAAWRTYGVDWVQLDPPRHLFLHTERSMGLLAHKAGLRIEKVVYDSGGFQFWGSELYRRDIPLTDERSPWNRRGTGMFSSEELADWEQQAQALNARSEGDQACFYLRRFSYPEPSPVAGRRRASMRLVDQNVYFTPN
jgi:SAM-dependent methyltransferase